MTSAEVAALADAADGAPGWRTTLYVMWFAQLVAIIGFSFVMSFMAFYVRELGVTDERLVPFWAGLLGSVTGLAFAVAAPLWGIVADRVGRRPMVLRSMFAGAVVLTAMGLVRSASQLLALRFLQGMLTGTVGASVAMVSSVTPRRHLGFSLGLMQTAVFAGASLGPLAGGAVADRFGYRLPFYAAGAMLLFAALLVLLFTRESFSRREERKTEGGTLRLVRSTPGFSAMLAVFLLVNLAGTIVAPIFPLFVEQLSGNPATKGTLTGMLIAISGVLAALAAVAIGHLGDRIGQKKMLVVCTLMSGLCCLPQAIVTNVAQLLGLRAVLGLASGGTGPTINALVGKLVPRGRYGRVYGMTSSVAALGAALGPLLGGALASVLGLRMPFVLTGMMLVFISGVATLRVKEPAPVATALPEETWAAVPEAADLEGSKRSLAATRMN